MRIRLDRDRLARFLLVAASLSALCAFVVTVSGGIDSRVLGVRVSSREPHRATVVAILAAVAGFILVGQREERWRALALAVKRLGLPVAAVLAIVVLWIGLQFGARTAGGADSYGYVSQAYLWLDGTLQVHQPLADGAPWPNADWTFSPLGYRPGTTPQTIVPTYSAGLPLIMAGFALLLGSCGPYVVTPVFGAALILLTYQLARRVSGRATAVIASLLIATSPTLLFWLLMPMSDVTVSALWTAALVLSFGRTSLAAIASGGVAAAAILVRPNLTPLAIVAAAILMWLPGRKWGALGTLVLFVGASAPGVVMTAVINSRLFGSALESGYGSLWSLYSIDNLPANLQRYPLWLLESQGVLVFIFLLGLFRKGTGSDATPWRALFLLFIALVVGPYLLYVPFDAWWFLRFLLPALPLVFILVADTLLWMTSRLAQPWRAIAVLGGCALLIVHAVRYAGDHVSGHAAGEARYAKVGHFIARELPAMAVCLSMQHSGSIRHYSPCVSVRYDNLDPEWLDGALAHFVSRGYHPYIVLDRSEESSFRRRFQQHSTMGLLDWTPIAELAGPHEVRIYDVSHADQRSDRRPRQIPEVDRPRCLGPWPGNRGALTRASTTFALLAGSVEYGRLCRQPEALPRE